MKTYKTYMKTIATKSLRQKTISYKISKLNFCSGRKNWLHIHLAIFAYWTEIFGIHVKLSISLIVEICFCQCISLCYLRRAQHTLITKYIKILIEISS